MLIHSHTLTDSI